MKKDVFRVTVAFFLTFGCASAKAHAQGGAGVFFGGGLPGGAAARAGGAIAGGGWQAGGMPGAGNPAGFGNAPGFGGNGLQWVGGFPGQQAGFNGGVPGAMAWSNAHPYPWYNSHWHNHWYGNGFGGYQNFNMLPPLQAVLTSSSAPSNPWDRFGTGSGMGGYAGANYPSAWGVGGWGMGNQWYRSGYTSYYNPYNDPGITTAFNYGRPIPVPTGAKLTDTDNPAIGLAIDRFRAGDYAKALSLVDGVINMQPFDAAAHELRGVILFAMKNYTAAAATIHSVLATGPGWDWTTLSSVYSNMQLYGSQLTALENYVELHPREGSARFLLAYHYMTEGRTDAAKEQLEQVVALVPGDKLAANLLHMVDSGDETQPADPPGPDPNPAAPPPDAKPLDPAALVGTWHAKRDDGATFDLKLGADKTYTWKLNQQNQSQTISGNYTLDKAMLTLQDGNQGGMVAQVTIDGANRFTFKPQGGAPNDPGLTFTK